MLLSLKDVSQLIEPISADSPCGPYLKNNKSVFRPLRNEFNVAQTSLRKLSQNPSAEVLDDLKDENHQNWLQLSESLFDQLSNSSRDIELIGWFFTSQMLLDPSLNSAANTLHWLAELVEHQWGHLNPVIASGKLKSDTEAGWAAEQTRAKVKAFFQMVGDSEQSSLVYAPLLLQPLVADVSFFEYQSSEQKGAISQLKQHVSSNIAHERTEILQKLESVHRCFVELERLRKTTLAYSQISGVSAPNFGFLKSLLTKYDYALQQLTNMKFEPKKSATTQGAQSEGANEAPSVDEPTPQKAQLSTQVSAQEGLMNSEQSSQIFCSSNLAETASTNSMNRDLAFHQLRELSDYFRQSEPHSPVSFLLEKAIRWGYLSLPELMKEMMEEQDGTSLNNIFNAAGLNHLDQVLLPDVDVPSVDIRNPLTFTSPSQNVESVKAEEPVSEASTADTQSQQKSELQASSSTSTALAW
ncbi:type VI secretion protein [Vibrio sp. 03-59-1]|uniref:type VI secretion system protein TssA n=1 Tax=Vibrio sp. 03-59-1 TaxID=2607607 RepID=UPI001493543B|nr:type VI secretion system ImpA family N-terminal domain-containing protein [Vibrio sp. 03-59-1]NOH85826.1 type VI secretion protein [Vibrio sp. 03-59-1]